jgi:septum formation protein
MIAKKKFILASRSPRRMHLLRQIGLKFEVRESNVDEEFDSSKSPEEIVRVLALLKASAVARDARNALVLGADTIVVLGKRILGKPRNRQDACRMLSLLSGRTHVVYTGLALIDRPSNAACTAVERTEVKFRKLTTDEIRAYVRTGSPMDKAGAYGIQDDFGAVFVERIEGCFYNVVGLPLSKFYYMMQRFQRRIQAR